MCKKTETKKKKKKKKKKKNFFCAENLKRKKDISFRKILALEI